METINERIKYIIDQYYNGTVSNFAKEVGVTQSTMSQIVSRNKNNPTAATVEKILNASAVNISPNWLVTGRGSILLNQEEENEVQQLLKGLSAILEQKEKEIVQLKKNERELIEACAVLKFRMENNINIDPKKAM